VGSGFEAPAAKAGMALAAIIAAIINATVKTNTMRLNALPVTVCCCPITSSFFRLMGLLYTQSLAAKET